MRQYSDKVISIFVRLIFWACYSKNIMCVFSITPTNDEFILSGRPAHVVTEFAENK